MSTDAMYNAESRFLHQKFVIHFSPTEVLEVTRSDYLLTSSILEESYKSTDSPFGEVTSNELNISLYDEGGMFNPANTQGKYYGLIRKGVKIEAFIRPDEDEEWDPLGVFYVTDWSTSTSGLSADVTANDALHNVINGSVPKLPVFRNIRLVAFLDAYFAYFGYRVGVDPDLDIVLPYVYTSEHSNNKAFLTELMLGIVADCFCDHSGEIRVVSKINRSSLRATLTDNDQIVTVAIKHTIVNSYDSAVVTYNVGQESTEESILSVKEAPVVVGTQSTGKLEFSKRPVLAVKSIKVTGAQTVRPTRFNANSKEFECTLQSSSDTVVNMEVIGTVLELVPNILGEALEAPLELTSKFLQTKSAAETVKEYADDYVASNMPSLELTVRGNPKLQLGDKVEVNSAYYRVNYIGVIISALYEYQGSLSCKLKLAMLGGV